MTVRFLPVLLLLLMPLFSTAQADKSSAVIEQWQQLPRDSNKSFAATHSYRSGNAPQVFHDGTFLPGSEQALKAATINDVVGPFQKANAQFLLRLDSTGMTCDSVQAAHILIAWKGSASAAGVTRTREQARKRADSLCALITSGKALFEDFVVPGITDDPGSLQGNKGNYGWFTRESAFIEIFKQSAFAHAVGETFVFESDFGFHIMQVKAKTKEYSSYFAWQIVNLIDTCLQEDGVTPVVHWGGYPGGRTNLDKVIAKRRTQYPSIAKSDGSHSNVKVMFDVLPDGSVRNVRLEYAERLTSRQRIEIQKLFLSLNGFIPQRICNQETGYTETYFFEI